MIDVKKYVSFMQQYKLTQQQILMLYFINDLHYLHNDAKNYINRFLELDEDFVIPISLFEDMVEKDLISIKNEFGNKADLYNYSPTKLLRTILVSNEASDEFLKLYPPVIRKFFGKSSGFIPTTTADADKFRTMYKALVKYSQEEHEKMLSDLRFAIENGLILMGIDKYFASEFYLRVREIRENGGDLSTVVEQNKLLDDERHSF